MITLPNYTVYVPIVPELTLSMRARYKEPGSRSSGDFTVLTVPAGEFPSVPNPVINNYTFTLPIPPLTRDWLEVYVDNFRIMNPTSTANYFDPEFPTWSYVGNSIDQINIVYPFTPTTQVTFIHYRSPTHYYGALTVDLDNVQSMYEQKQLTEFLFREYPIIAGRARGTNYQIFVKPGVKFEQGSTVYVQGCSPSVFNGLHTVTNSTLNDFRFVSQTSSTARIATKGTVMGFGNGTINTVAGIGLYCEPLIISQPYHGHVRLTTDRKKIAYTPDLGYVGKDTFAVSLINQNGQIAEPKCILIEMTANTN